MKKILERLYEHQQLSYEEARSIMLRITNGEINAAQLSSFMTVYLMRPIDMDELVGFRDALLEQCVQVDWDGIESIDIVGTGGDGKNTFNISTLASFVIAGAGYKVTKHGNYGSSSVSGSSNTLERLGYEFTADTDTLRKQLDTANICFFHAPKFHPAMRHVGAVRRELGVRTFFNLLGPLSHPLQPTHQLFGTSAIKISRLYEYIMQASGRQFSIVHSLDGYDEISLTTAFDIRTNKRHQVIHPKDIGMKKTAAKAISGGENQATAVRIFTNILNGEGTTAQKDVVLANAAFGIQTIKPQQSIADCLLEAEASLDSGKALDCLKQLIAG